MKLVVFFISCLIETQNKTLFYCSVYNDEKVKVFVSIFCGILPVTVWCLLKRFQNVFSYFCRVSELDIGK